MKKYFTTISIITGLILISISVNAQKYVKLADEQYNLYNYSEAVGLYQKAFKKTPTAYIAEHIAASYHFMRDYPNTETWYAKLVTLPDSKPVNVFKYAEALRDNSKYAEAREQYTKYYTLSKDVDKFKLKGYLATCDSALKWMKTPAMVDINNELALNSEQSDWGAVVYNNLVVFSSDRVNKKVVAEVPKEKKPFLRFDGKKLPPKNKYGWTGNSYLHLYQYEKTPDTVKLFSFTAGTEYHVGPPSFTKDGNQMYFTLTRIPQNWNTDNTAIKTIRLEIYSSKKIAGTDKWEKPVPFRYNNADKWSTGDPFITPDGQTLYFVSDMPGGQGGTDIYKCSLDAAGKWTDLINIKALNTPGNERTPVLDADNNVFYASDGGVGMGGLDIFKALHKGAEFGPKQNMGFPVNSPQDDFAYLPKDKLSGYLSSNRSRGIGSDDIYSFAWAPVVSYRLEGIVYDRITKAVIPNSLVTLTAVPGKLVTTRTDAAGQYVFGLQEKTNYKLKGEKSGYLSDNQTTTTIGADPVKTIKKDLYLEQIVLNKAIKIENIYYDYDKADIRRDAAVELDKLIRILKDNPTIQIELGSHTDARGNDDYNKNLSQRRANAAVEYIIRVGAIDEDRITARGYGESRLLNRCRNGVKCSDAEHQLNRRTEFTIVKY